MLLKTFSAAATAALLILSGGAHAQAPGNGTLQRIKERGHLECGSNQGVPGFSQPDDKGVWRGFDIEFCRALAAAIFNDTEKVRFSPLSSKDRFLALQSGNIDVLSRQTTWTISREITQGLSFTAINYYDGQGFLVRKASGIKSALELGGATICVPQGTTSELNAADYLRANNIRYQLVAFATVDEVTKAYESGRCDTYTTDMSALASTRFLMQNPDEHMILPEVISKEPLGPWVRKSDSQWFDIVRWTLFAMISAEELGVTRANVEDMAKSPNPEIRRLLGIDGNYGETLGLTRDWAFRVIKHIGNYGESFDRNLGAGSRIGLPRGPNRLWNAGGLQYSPPFR
jgi:general L-amino acid transport system substrate-binding protein